jgi:DNA-binding MarR family transcriptional regulator
MHQKMFWAILPARNDHIMPDSSPRMLPDNPTLGKLLMVAHRLAHQRYCTATDAYDLTPAHVEVLRLVQRGEASTVGTLAERSHVTPPVMTALVETLTVRGYIERLPDPADRRRARLALTDSGQRVTDELVVIRQHVNDALAALLTEQERHLLETLLRKIIVALSADPAPDDARA